jgi:putative protein-disulfide isomerase
MTAKLFYFHDPMCSWCWGFAPTWSRLEDDLKQTFGNNIAIEYVLGGLAPDNDNPMPFELQETLQSYWRKIHQLLGTEFNFDFWTQCQPRRSTYPACRAVIAASNQGEEKSMIKALQEAYYLRALNPSNTETHLLLAEELNLDIEQFSYDISSEQTESRLKNDIQLYRKLSSNGFPSLTLQTQGRLYPISVDYKQSDVMSDSIKELLTDKIRE